MEPRRSMRARTAEPEYPPIVLDGHSQRFIRFHKAFHYAFKQANEKWTLEDLRSCFPTLYAKNPGVFENIRNASIEEGRLHADVRERSVHHLHRTDVIMDALHEAIQNAKERAKEAETDATVMQTDTWNPVLDPQAAVRAHFVPLMRTEIDRLKKQIADLEEKDEGLDAEIKENNAAQAAATDKVKALLLNVQNVADDLSSKLRTDEMVEWALEVDETGEA